MIEISAGTHKLDSCIQISGSKSISNRLLILKTLLNSDLVIENLSDSEDTQLLQKALTSVKNKSQTLIDIHHAGTDMRFLTALLSVTEGEWILTGSERMKERPIGELVNALRALGADITYPEKENYPPLKIQGKKLKGGTVDINSSISSQFVSALLLIAPVLERGLVLRLKGKSVSRPYIDMTISLLKDFGFEVQESSQTFTVLPSPVLRVPSSVTVESDWSSASYWYSICALSPNSTLELRSFSKTSMQADSVLPLIFRDLGVETVVKGASLLLTHSHPLVKTFRYDFTDCPDIAQTIAVTCFALGIKAELHGLSTLKVKETDRLLALKQELEKCGATVSITSDSIHIDRRSTSHNSLAPQIHTYNDHRMAMSFAPLALVFGKLKIDAPEVVHKSYPAFWEDLKSLGFNVNLQP